MIKLSRKRLLLFVSALAMAGLALPSMSSAATFDGVGNHTLTSSVLAFTVGGFLSLGWNCTSSVLEVNVAAGGATASVTGATFDGCTGTDRLAGQAATVTTSNFPWTLTRTLTSVFTIDGIHALVHFPGAALDVTVTGSIVGGAINNTTHTVTYVAATGMTATAIGGGLFNQSGSMGLWGHFTDDQGTLAVT
jgi:hypothetical protein